MANSYFWDGGQATLRALSFSPHSTISRCGSHQALAVASHGVRRQPATKAIIEPHENRRWSGRLAVNGYHPDKTPVQRAPLRSAKCADNAGRPGDTVYDGDLQHLYGRSSNNCGQTHDHWVCRYSYTVGFNSLPQVCKINPDNRLFSLSVLWQHSSCRGTWPPLNSELMTVLWQQGQFSAYGNSLHSFSTMTSSRYPVSSSILKLWITIMQLQKTFPSFGRKLKETWHKLMSAALHSLILLLVRHTHFGFHNDPHL